MGSISLQIPQSGQPFSTEGPKVASDMTTIQTVINGNLDTTNLSSSAAIAFTQLAKGAWTSITPATNVGSSAGLYTAQVRLFGDLIQMRGGLKNNTGGSITAFGTIPVGFRPASTVLFPIAATGGAALVGQIDTSGNLITTIGVANLSVIVFDGLQYSLS